MRLQRESVFQQDMRPTPTTEEACTNGVAGSVESPQSVRALRIHRVRALRIEKSALPARTCYPSQLAEKWTYCTIFVHIDLPPG